jgi:hypothetical protein
MSHVSGYPSRMKDQFIKRALNAINKKGSKYGVLKSIASEPGAPSERTLRTWLHNVDSPPPTNSKISQRGHPNALSNEQAMVLGGRIVFALEENSLVDQSFVQAFVFDAFGIEVSNTWVSRYMKDNGFTSKITRANNDNKDKKKMRAEMLSWFTQLGKKIGKKFNKKKIVAMDQIMLWDVGIPLRGYGIRGGYVNSCIVQITVFHLTS